MQRQDHLLLSPSLGAHKTLTSFHFGQPGTGPKIYIQASLHAEELPGMLAAYHLRPLLERLDAAGQISGNVVLVPMANPIGAAQRVQHKPVGRFELDSGENFNRYYPDFARHIADEVLPTLGKDAVANVALVRQAMGRHLEQWIPKTELHSLRRTLLQLSFDADYVLDLHCDCEAVMHFYCEEACWSALEPLAHYLQSRAILLAKNSGSSPFDECLSGVWWRLGERIAANTAYWLMMLGAVGVLVTTIILKFGASWVFLYPLSFYGSGDWGNDDGEDIVYDWPGYNNGNLEISLSQLFTAHGTAPPDPDPDTGTAPVDTGTPPVDTGVPAPVDTGTGEGPPDRVGLAGDRVSVDGIGGCQVVAASPGWGVALLALGGVLRRRR